MFVSVRRCRAGRVRFREVLENSACSLEWFERKESVAVEVTLEAANCVDSNTSNALK